MSRRSPDPSSTLKILLTEGSSTSARQTLYALGPRHTIDVLDSGRMSQCRFSRYVRRWHHCPSYSKTPTEYLRFLCRTLRSESYDVLLPTHEQVYLLARVRDSLSKYAGLALPPFEILDQMQNKATFVRVLSNLGIPCPITRFASSRNDLEQQTTFPCYVKLAHSTAGNGVHMVRDQADMVEVADRLEQQRLLEGDVELLVQQPAVGTLSVAQCVFQNGQLVGAHCTQALAQGVGGAPTARVSVRHPVVLQHMEKLGRHLNWHGAMFVEYFYGNDTEQAQYIEANPRIGETLNATLCGVNLCEQLLKVSLDQAVAPQLSGKTGVRSHQTFVGLMASAQQGANRRSLLAELLRVWRRRGTFHESVDELTRPSEDLYSVIPATAVILQILSAPSRAVHIVRQTVDNYSLPDAAARLIRELPADTLERSFG